MCLVTSMQTFCSLVGGLLSWSTGVFALKLGCGLLLCRAHHQLCTMEFRDKGCSSMRHHLLDEFLLDYKVSMHVFIWSHVSILAKKICVEMPLRGISAYFSIQKIPLRGILELGGTSAFYTGSDAGKSLYSPDQGTKLGLGPGFKTHGQCRRNQSLKQRASVAPQSDDLSSQN